MDGPKKQQLIEALTKRLEDSANSTDEFGLSGRDVGQIVTNIVEDFEKYVEYRNSDKWKDEEGYKWEFIKNRFDNSSVKPIPDVLPNEFFSLRKNLGGSFHGDPFQDKVPWESVTLTNFRDINETDFNTIDVDNEIKKAKNFIEKINKKSNTRATALLLFFLFPKKFCSYNHGSLSKTAKNWGIPDTSPMIPPKGDICYKSWIKFINEIMIPTFKETGTFGDLRQIDNDVPRGIPLDIQDFIYCINKGWLDNLTANTTSQNQTGDNTMKDNFIEILQKLRANKQLILTGAPGTGKTYLAQRLAAWMISDSSEEYPEDISDVEITYETYKDDLKKSFIQFHPSYDYSDFVVGLKPKLVNDSVSFEWKDGIFKKICDEASKKENENNNYAVIIDEINRTDLSRVFGELFFCLEEDYRGNSVTLPSSDTFTIPENVYIIGTMNDIDRSVESMDFALRRRFAWHEITAEESAHIIDASNISNNKDDIVEEAKKRMENLNNALVAEANLGEEYKLGGAYFKKIEKYCDGGNADWQALWDNHLGVILREYLRGRKNAGDIMEKLKKAYKTNDSSAQEDAASNSTPENPAP